MKRKTRQNAREFINKDMQFGTDTRFWVGCPDRPDDEGFARDRDFLLVEARQAHAT